MDRQDKYPKQDKCSLFRGKAMNREAEATTRRRHPHWQNDRAIYWITIRLADAIPPYKRRAINEKGLPASAGQAAPPSNTIPRWLGRIGKVHR